LVQEQNNHQSILAISWIARTESIRELPNQHLPVQAFPRQSHPFHGGHHFLISLLGLMDILVMLDLDNQNVSKKLVDFFKR